MASSGKAVGLVLVATLAGAGLGAWLLMREPERSGPEALLRENFYSADRGLYHVADVQRRPEVQAAIAHFHAAGLCEFIFKMHTTRMNSDVTMSKTCARSAQGLHQWWHDHELALDPFALTSGTPTGQFALLVDAAQTPYLFAAGKHGELTADQLAALVVTLLDAAVAEAPAALEAQKARAMGEEKARRETEEKRQRAAESFK